MADNESTLVVNVDASSAEDSLNKLARSLDAVMIEAGKTAPTISKINTELTSINKNIAEGKVRTLEKDIDTAGVKVEKLNAQLQKLNSVVNQMSTMTAQLRSLEAMAGKTTILGARITELNKKLSTMNGQITRLNNSGEQFGITSTHIQKIAQPLNKVSTEFKRAEIASNSVNEAIKRGSARSAANMDSLQKVIQKNAERTKVLSSTTEKATTRMVKSSNEHTSAIKRTSKEMQNMAKYGTYNIEQVSKKSENFGQTLVRMTKAAIAATMAYQAVRGIVEGVTNFVKSTIDTAVYFEKMQSSMTAITGSYKNAAVEVDYLSETSKKYGVSVEEVGMAYVKLSAAARGTSFSLEDVHRVFEATVISGRVLNLTGLEMKGMLYALQQMISKGKVSMEELRLQLGDRLPGAMGLAAAAMGMPVAQLEKLISTGGLRSIEFLKKFSDYIITQFSPGMEVASTTIEFARGKFQNFYTDMKKTFGMGMKTQYAETLDLFTIGLQNMSDEAERTGQSIGKMWSGANEYLTRLVSGATSENMSLYFDALEQQFNELLISMGTNTSQVSQLIENILFGLGTTWDEVFAYLPTAPFDLLKNLESAFSTSGRKIIVATNTIMLSFLGLARAIVETILLIPQKILQTMQNMINSVVVLTANAIDAINASLPEAIRIEYDRSSVDNYVRDTNEKLANMSSNVGEFLFGTMQETYTRIIQNNSKIIDSTEADINNRYESRVNSLNSKMDRNNKDAQNFLEKMRKTREDTMEKMKQFQMDIASFPEGDVADNKALKKTESSLKSLKQVLAELYNTSDDSADKVAKLTLKYAEYAKVLGETHPMVKKLGVAIEFLNEHGLTPGEWIENTKKAQKELEKLSKTLDNVIAYGSEKNPNEYLQAIIEAEKEYAQNIKKGKEQIEERTAAKIKEAQISKAYYEQEDRFTKFRAETYSMSANNKGNTTEAFRQELNEKILAWQQAGYQQIDIDARVNEELIQHNNQYVTTVEESWKEAWKRIDSAMVDALTGAGDVFNQLKDAFKQMLAEMAYQALLRPVVVQIMTVAGSMLNIGGGQLSYQNGAVVNGSGGSGALQALPSLFGGSSSTGSKGFLSSLLPTGVTDWFSGLGESLTSGINSLASNWFPNTFASNATGGQLNSLVNSITGSSLPTGTLSSGVSELLGGLSSAFSYFTIGKTLADSLGLSKTYTDVGTGVGTGAAIGSAFGPIGAGIGAVIGGIGGRLFGKRKPKRPAVWGGLDVNLGQGDSYSDMATDEWFNKYFDEKNYGRSEFEITQSGNYFAATRDRNKAGKEASEAMNKVMVEVAKAGVEEASNIRKALPEKYATSFNDYLKNNSIRFSYDFKGDDISEEKFQEMAEEMAQKIEERLIEAFASLDLSEFEGKINIDKTTMEGIQNFVTAIGLVNDVQKATNELIQPSTQIIESAQNMIDQLDEWKSAMTEVGVTTEYATQLLDAYKDAAINDFIRSLKQMVEPTSEIVDQAQKAATSFTEYAEALKMLGATEAQLSEVDTVKSKYIQNMVDAIKQITSPTSEIVQKAKDVSKTFAEYAEALKILGASDSQLGEVESTKTEYINNTIKSINEMVNPISDFVTESANAKKNFDDYIEAMKILGATEEQLASVELARAQYSKKTLNEILTTITPKSEYTTITEQANKTMDDWIAGLKALGVAQSELILVESKRKEYIDSMLASLMQPFYLDLNSRWASIKDESGESSLLISQADELRDIVSKFGKGSKQYFEMVQLQEAELAKFRVDKAQKEYDALKSQMDSLLSQQLSDLKTLQDAWKRVSESLLDTMTKMWTGSANVNSSSRLDASMTDFNELYKKALAGDSDAASKLGSSGQELLELAKQTYGMESDYIDLFYDTYGKIEDVQKYAKTQSDQIQAQIKLAEDQLNELRGISSTSQSIDIQIADLKPRLDQAFNNLQDALKNLEIKVEVSGDFGSGGNISGSGSSGGGSSGGSTSKPSTSGPYNGKYQYEILVEKANRMNAERFQGRTDWDYRTASGIINKTTGSFDTWWNKYGKYEGFATGGIAQGLFKVGERGPEMMFSSDPVRVINNHDTRRFLESSSIDDRVAEYLERMILEEREIGKILVNIHSDIIRTRIASESTFDILEAQYMQSDSQVEVQ